jgi:hypothetical protein
VIQPVIFELMISGKHLKPEMDLQGVAAGYSLKNLKVVPDPNEVVDNLIPSQ